MAIRLGNGLDWCLAFLGIQLAGAIAVPVNTRFSESEVEYVIQDSGSKFVSHAGRSAPGRPAVAVEDLAHGDVAAIFYTSGTTGFPKGAMTTHEGFLSNIETCARVVPLPKDGSVRTLVSVPLFHVTGCNSQLLPSCASGGATIIMPAFNVQSFLALINAERVNSLTSVPAVYWLAIQQPNFEEIDTKGVRWLSYGGAPIASGPGRAYSRVVSQRTSRQRIRPHRDQLGRHFPSARIRAGSSGNGRLRRAGCRLEAEAISGRCRRAC